MPACKICILTRARVLARGMIALGFTIEACKERVQPMLEEAGFTLTLLKNRGAYWGDELIANNVEPDRQRHEMDHYVVCRSTNI